MPSSAKFPVLSIVSKFVVVTTPVERNRGELENLLGEIEGEKVGNEVVGLSVGYGVGIPVGLTDGPGVGINVGNLRRNK